MENPESNHKTCPIAQSTLVSFVKNHPYAVLFGLIGLIAALLILIIGFWATLLIALLISLGAALGSYKDGNRFVRDRLKDFISRMK